MQQCKINVMHIIRNLKPDGAQQAVRTLVEYQASGNCVPTVCTFLDGPLRQDIEQLGIKVEILPPRRYSVIAFPLFAADMIRIWRALTVLVKQYQIDVIQTHLLETLDFLVLLLRYTTRVRVILWTFQNVKIGLTADQLKHKWLFKPKRFSHNLLYRLTYPLVSGFIAVSNEVKQAVAKEICPIQDKITIICNAVDVKRYSQPTDAANTRSQLGFQANDRLIAVVGRLTEQKGHRYMLEAMTSIVPLYPDVHVLFLGVGELREELQTQVERLGLDRRVHFLGSRKDIPDLLAASEIFVLPSLWEGLSVALLEAMAAGKPIVATAVSGTSQTMRPGETGLVVPPGNSQALADAIIQLLSNPEQARSVGQAAQRYVAVNFSAQKQAEEHLALYCRLLKKRE